MMTSTRQFLFLITNILLWRHIYTAIHNSNATMISECYSGDSINITTPLEFDNELMPEIQLPPNRINDYVYEIIHNTSVRLTTNSTRSCICQSRQCIQLCSYDVHALYRNMLANNRSNADMDIFYIDLTLDNGTMVRRHIIRDFQSTVYTQFCESSYSLSTELDFKNSWAWFENGTLLRHHDETYLAGNEYCFDVDEDENSHTFRINPQNCAIENVMSQLEVANNTTMLISIPFFLLTILAYFVIPELWNLQGKCFISYLSSITLSYSLLSFANLTHLKYEFTVCILLGFLNHYLQLAYYTWLGIICYDTWKSCSDLKQNASYSMYASFGWLMPLLGTLFTLIAQISDISESLKPGITAQHCGLDVNKWSASIYLYGPCLVILLFCLFSFIATSRIIKKNDKDIHQYHTGYDVHRSRYTLYLRLFIVMGLSWFMDVISYFFAMFEMSRSSFLMDFINSIQGLYIFLNFIGRRRIRDILRERFLFTTHKGSYSINSSSSQEYQDTSGESFSERTGRSLSVETDITYVKF